MHVAVIDIGKPGKNLGWAIVGSSPASGTDLDEAIDEISDRISRGPVALGFEAPLYVPMRSAAGDLTKARSGECVGGVNRPYSASAGSTVLVIATVVVPYVLRALRSAAPVSIATMDYRSFFSAPAGVLFFEAFVTNQKKSHDARHVEDAELAAMHLLAMLEEQRPLESAICEPECLNLLGAMMLRTGWTSDLSVLDDQCLVVRPPVGTL
jgi:hypothetical protein